MTLYSKYQELFESCESHNEERFVSGLYEQLQTREQAAFFMAMLSQQIVIPDRQYRIDFIALYQDRKYAIEIEGGVFSKKLASVGYRSILGYINHADKYNTLARWGWSVFRFQLHKPQLNDLWGVLGV